MMMKIINQYVINFSFIGNCKVLQRTIFSFRSAGTAGICGVLLCVIIGKDTDNCPVYLNRVSAVDFPRVIADFGLDKAIEFAIHIQEKLLEDNPRGECIVIIDFASKTSPIRPRRLSWKQEHGFQLCFDSFNHLL